MCGARHSDAYTKTTIRDLLNHSDVLNFSSFNKHLCYLKYILIMCHTDFCKLQLEPGIPSKALMTPSEPKILVVAVAATSVVSGEP